MVESRSRVMPDIGDDYAQKNRVVKECLRSPSKRGVLDDSLAESISRDVYDLSLARVLLEPQIMRDGQLPRPVSSEAGPAVEVRLTEDRETVVLKNSYRDSVEEEVRTTVRSRLSFSDAKRSVASPRDTFEVANIAKFKSLGLNGSAYALVERARQRMSWAMANDETKLAIRCILWAAGNIGRLKVSLFKSRVAEHVGRELARTQDLVAMSAVLAHPRDAVDHFMGGCLLDPATAGQQMASPFARIKVLGNIHPVYAHFDIPQGQVVVLPIGRSLGTLAIEKEPKVASNDKAERFVTGWTCGERIGIVLANAPWISTVFIGPTGLAKFAAMVWRRLWRRQESVVERVDG